MPKIAGRKPNPRALSFCRRAEALLRTHAKSRTPISARTSTPAPQSAPAAHFMEEINKVETARDDARDTLETSPTPRVDLFGAQLSDNGGDEVRPTKAGESPNRSIGIGRARRQSRADRDSRQKAGQVRIHSDRIPASRLSLQPRCLHFAAGKRILHRAAFIPKEPASAGILPRNALSGDHTPRKTVPLDCNDAKPDGESLRLVYFGARMRRTGDDELGADRLGPGRRPLCRCGCGGRTRRARMAGTVFCGTYPAGLQTQDRRQLGPRCV